MKSVLQICKIKCKENGGIDVTLTLIRWCSKVKKENINFSFEENNFNVYQCNYFLFPPCVHFLKSQIYFIEIDFEDI